MEAKKKSSPCFRTGIDLLAVIAFIEFSPSKLFPDGVVANPRQLGRELRGIASPSCIRRYF